MDFDPDNPTPPGGSEKEPPKDAPKAADKTGPAGLAPGVGSGLASGAASGVASLGGQFSTIVDLPRFRGLYRAMESVSLPIPGIGAPARGTLADLDHLYPQELGPALAERKELTDELAEILALPEGDRDATLKARLEGELLKLERRLWLHNRRTREAHLALADTLNRGWPDLLSSLARAINFLERLRANLAPAVAWGKKELKIDPGLVRAAVDSTLERLLDLLRNLGLSLNDLYRLTREAYENSHPAPPPASDLSAVLGNPESPGPSGTRLPEGAPPAGPQGRRPGPDPGSEPDTGPVPGSAPGPVSVSAPVPEAELLARLESLPVKCPKGRRELTREIQTLDEALRNLRLFFLARLLETEETVIAWRGQDEASIKAPDPISVPDPPPLAPAARIGPIAGGKGPFRMSLRFRRWFIFFSLIVVAAVTVIWLEKNKIGRPGVIHAYNGLSSPVTVTVGDVQHSVLSGSAVAINWPKGATSIMTHSPEGFIEIVEDIPEPERGQNLVYNVAGASPLFEWEAVYSLDAPEGPPTEIPLGAPKLLVTTADFVLTDPPKSAKVSANNPTKRVLSALSGVHPARMLELLNPQERLPVIEAQARWNRPGSLWSPLWLDLLASNSPKAAGILLSRVADFPRDPWTLGYLLKVLGAKNLVGFCLELQSLTNSDDDPDLAYLASLCLPAEERSQRLGELLKLWPNQPWLNRAAGWELFAKDDLEGALWYLDQAFEHDPSTLLPELETLARLRHLHGLPASILAEEFNFWVPGLATLTNRESAERRDFYRLSARDRSPESSLSPQDQAYVLLDRGLMSKALELAEPGPLHDRLTRLAGASAGADQEMVEKALTLPLDRGLDRDTAWSMLGLAVKHRRDTLPYAKIIAETSPAPAPLLAKAIMEGDAGNLGILIPGREAWLQGQACLAAEIAGLKLPEKCPLKARGFLFVGEKPYLTPLPPESRPTHNQSDPSDPYGHPTPDQPPDPFDLEGRPARDQAPDPASLPAPNQSTDPASPPATGTQGEIATSQGNPEASLPETPLESPLDSPHSSE